MNVDKEHDNETLALERLAAQYGRTHGVLTASGTCALEAALHHVGVAGGAEVILPDIGCYKVGAAVLRQGGTPVFTAVGPGLVLDADTVAAAVTFQTRCVVAVHQYGLPCHVAGLRDALPEGVRIIEDVAQSWGTLAGGRPVGRDSDVVVTSFGRTKPVPLGAGGALLGDDPGLADLVASDNLSHRALAAPAISAPFPMPLVRDLLHCLANAGTLTRQCRDFAAALVPTFTDGRYALPILRQGDVPSWHRLPIRCATRFDQNRLLAAASRTGLRAQMEHRVRLPDLPMFRDRCRTVRGTELGPDGHGGSSLVVLYPDNDVSLARGLRAALLADHHPIDGNPGQ